MLPLRIAARRVHLWLGMSLGLLIALLGLTGALLVFYIEIDEAIHPQVASQSPEPAPGWNSPIWDVALATGNAQYPAPRGEWSFEVSGRSGAIPARFYLHGSRSGHHVERTMVWFSSDGRQVIRSDPWGGYAMSWLYELHMHLLAGDPGGMVVGWGGFATLFILLTGIASWWPRGSLRNALSFKRRAAAIRRMRDLHKHVGVWSLPVLFLLLFTGGLLALPQVKIQLLAALVTAPDTVAAPRVEPSSRPRASLVQVLAAGHAALPRSRLAFIDVSADPALPIRLRVQQPGDPHQRFPSSFIFVDPYTATVLAVHDVDRGNVATRIGMWIRPIHDGSIGGLATRVLTVLLGLAPLALGITGFFYWQQRRLRRRAANHSLHVHQR